MVPADSNGISPVPPYSGYRYNIKTYLYWTLTIYGWPSHAIPIQFNIPMSQSYNPNIAVTTLVWAIPHFARHY